MKNLTFATEKNVKNMIKNLVFDFGGVVVDLNWDKAVRHFAELGLPNADKVLDRYKQNGLFLELEEGKITAEEFKKGLEAMCGRELSDEELLKADIFKVGHHGQKDGIDEKHFRMISPGLTICCASSDRRYDSADPRLIRMIRENGSELRFSDCPKLPEDMGSIPPHRLLRITVGGEMSIEASYIL